jgi:hypothetical protein
VPAFVQIQVRGGLGSGDFIAAHDHVECISQSGGLEQPGQMMACGFEATARAVSPEFASVTQQR